jgi:hypothetical protein
MHRDSVIQPIFQPLLKDERTFLCHTEESMRSKQKSGLMTIKVKEIPRPQRELIEVEITVLEEPDPEPGFVEITVIEDEDAVPNRKIAPPADAIFLVRTKTNCGYAWRPRKTRRTKQKAA